MAKLIKIGEDAGIDLEKLIETRLLIQANSGGGKSWLIRRLLEQTHGKVQQIVLDPEGEFGTLREKYDYILAGKHADLSAEPKYAAKMAEKLLETRASTIIDLYELPPQERKRFVRLFLEAMVNAPKELYHQVLVVIDEAHVFVPQVGESEASSAVIDLATRGRKRGYCAVLATQRISKLHKDAAAECNNKIIGRTSQDIDMKRAADELGFTTREQIFSLRTLKPGEFYAFGPAISDEVKVIKVGDVATSHPKAGSRALGKIPKPSASIAKILGALADLPKEAEEEARTVSELKKQIVQLKKERAPRQIPTSDPLTIKQAVDKAVAVAVAAAVAAKDEELFKWQGEWLKTMDTWYSTLKTMGETMQEWKRTHRLKPQKYLPIKNILTDISPERLREVVSNASPGAVIQIPPTAKLEAIPPTGLSGPAQKILDAVAWLNVIGVEQPSKVAVAFVAGYSSTSSNYVKTCGALRSQDLVSYPPGSALELTEAGREVARVIDPPTSNEELHERIYTVLSDPERRILKPIVNEAGEPIAKMAVAEQAGYSETSSNFVKILGKLRTLGLISYPSPGNVAAEKLLFPL